MQARVAGNAISLHTHTEGQDKSRKGRVVSYLAPVLDKGLVGDEAKEEEAEADGPCACGTTVMGLGRPVEDDLPMVGLSWA